MTTKMKVNVPVIKLVTVAPTVKVLINVTVRMKVNVTVIKLVRETVTVKVTAPMTKRETFYSVLAVCTNTSKHINTYRIL